MDGMIEIARAFYERASEGEKTTVHEYFRRLDVNGDKKVSLLEFKKGVCSSNTSETVFRQLDVNGDGTLDFNEFLAFYYMAKTGIPGCDGCRQLLVGPYFSCSLCLGKGNDTFDLCCSCHRGGNIVHEHTPDNFLDHHSMLRLFRNSKTGQKSPGQKEMAQLFEIALAHYQASSPEAKTVFNNIFNSMDTNGDGKVDLPEFLAFTREQGHTRMQNPYFFKELDRDDKGNLDFTEVVTLYYIIKSGRPFCDACGKFIPGLYHSCLVCFKNPKDPFNICLDCYRSTKCNHKHNGVSQFLDNYTLLEHKRESTQIAQPSTDVTDYQYQHEEVVNSPTAFVPAQPPRRN